MCKSEQIAQKKSMLEVPFRLTLQKTLCINSAFCSVSLNGPLNKYFCLQFAHIDLHKDSSSKHQRH